MATKKTAPKVTKDVFKAKLAEYKGWIDADIQRYAKHVRQSTLQQYGANAHMEVDAYLKLLERGGKRIRGALTILGYEMSGGPMDEKGRAMILQAARAIEMVHAYILIVDDIQDRSQLRRGDKTAHVRHAGHHRKHGLAGDADHFGVALALNSALGGMHAAEMILADLDAPEQLRLNVLSILNRTMLVTVHGQTHDIMNEVVAHVTMPEVENVMRWKTATYTTLNPLHVGMVLAGADHHAIDAITPYATHTGMVFQITDDTLGTFGTEFESGKSPMDDIREGKRTMLAVYALEHTRGGDKNFLVHMLGNDKLTPAEFERCKEIMQDSGALDYARQQAKNHVTAALESLQKEAHRWSPDGVKFLEDLARYLLQRQS